MKRADDGLRDGRIYLNNNASELRLPTLDTADPTKNSMRSVLRSDAPVKDGSYPRTAVGAGGPTHQNSILWLPNPQEFHFLRSAEMMKLRPEDNRIRGLAVVGIPFNADSHMSCCERRH